MRWHFKQLTRDYRRRQKLQTELREQRLLEQQTCRQSADLREINIDNLPPRTREAVRHIHAGKTLTQAARQMRITPQAVRNLLNRARRLTLLEK